MLEIERRFRTPHPIGAILTSYVSEGKIDLTRKLIEQMYLTNTGHWTLRVRRVTYEDGLVKHFLTMKTLIESITDFEAEPEISVEQFQEFYDRFGVRGLMRKYRWTDSAGFEIDHFLNPVYNNLVIIERELKSETEHFDRPWYLGDEITLDRSLNNKNLYQLLPLK